MAQSRQNDQWNHTAALMAHWVNLHRDPKRSRAATPKDYHPQYQRAVTKAHLPKADLSILKSVFVDQRPR